MKSANIKCNLLLDHTRLLVNALIEVIKRSVYAQKDEIIRSMPKILGTIQRSRVKFYSVLL